MVRRGQLALAVMTCALLGGCALVAGIDEIVLSPPEDVEDIEAGVDSAAASEAGSFVEAAADQASVDDAAAGDSAAFDGAGEDAMPDTGPGPIGAGVGDITLFLGQRAVLNAALTRPAAATFTWRVDVPPPGSAISTASLQGAAEAIVSFVPDLPGTYILSLRVEVEGEVIDRRVGVTAFDADVFHLSLQAGGKGGVVVRPAHGGTARDVVCMSWGDAGSVAGLNGIFGAAAYATDWWQGPPGQPSRVVVQAMRRLPDGGTGFSMIAARSTDRCPGAGTDAGTGRTVLEEQTVDHPLQSLQPSFSPDGKRIAYLRDAPGGARLATVGFDGSDPHRQVAPIMANPDGSPRPSAGLPDVFNGFLKTVLRPRWLPDGRVAWVQRPTDTSWRIVAAPDADGSSPALLLRCEDPVRAPIQFAPLGNGTFVVALRRLDANVSGDLVVYESDAATKSCRALRTLGKIPGDSGWHTREFGLSQDGGMVAFIAGAVTADGGPVDGGPTRGIRIVPSDGTSPARRPPGAPTTGGWMGPRFVAGDTLVIWGHDGTGVTDLLGLPPDGGTLRTVAATRPGVETVIPVGNGLGCQIRGGPRTGVGTAYGMSLAAGLLLLRGARRRHTRDVPQHRR